MNEYEYLFVTNLHIKLKHVIDAAIFVKVTHDDQLYVEIKRFDLVFRGYICNDFSERIRNGYTTDYAVYEIVKEYKEFIHKIFFY